jgi:hypothetical protein
MLRTCPSFQKHAIEALLEDCDREVHALPDKATAAVNDHARGGKRLLIDLLINFEYKFLQAFQLEGSDAKTVRVRRLQVSQHCDRADAMVPKRGINFLHA